ncbi:hypothetical protein FKW42_09725 [Listeria monocytogenes]|uniref:Uncharacterized protein n=2 Tax=Listeriaceae TaxID=186820 RepID=A0A6Y7KEY0_LISMN|nr:hypothetical protein A7B02_02805 [Listeria monocytogenes]EAA0085142.1 hypothetical protein [Listeria monocytogenes]EAC3600433.1 hypothetical protein [Listeria monocytogenes]EAC4468692.1 hypothetical protein [Listeria monocytogenes]EAC8054618.1 hypothetical protein [Listeria monocytogenes]
MNMKKGMVLLTGFLLAFSIFLVGCSDAQKETQEKEEKNDMFYQTGMSYENELKNTYTILWDGSIDKIPNIDTFSNDNRQEVLNNLNTLETKLGEIKKEIESDKSLSSVNKEYVSNLSDGISKLEAMTIKLNAQVTTRGANTFADDNFNLEIKELQSDVDNYLNKAVEIRKKYTPSDK